MTTPELAAALVAAYEDRLGDTGPFDDPVPPCLAAVLRVLVDAAGSAKHLHVDQLNSIVDALEAMND